MGKNIVAVVYDRKKTAEKKGVGVIEVRITFSKTERKHINIGKCAPSEYPDILKEKEYAKKIQKYEDIVNCMVVLNEELTLETLNKHLGIENTNTTRLRGNSNFLEWLREQIATQNLRENTVRQKMVTLDALTSFGKIKLFNDLTPANLYAWDAWLREDKSRTDVTVFNYHRRLKPYIKVAYQQGIIDEDPYARCKFNRGKSKERKPLTEKELKKVRSLDLPLKQDRVRDLFVFSAYTGLAYCDLMLFDFKTMTEKHGDMYYIDGERVKSGGNFFTPILPPAMEVLKKYDFKLPKISNQKVNDYLHVLETRAELNKPLTFHIARHSFATLALTYDIPIDKLQRMMGHENIRTTQIYGKVFKNVLMNHAEGFSNAVK